MMAFQVAAQTNEALEQLLDSGVFKPVWREGFQVKGPMAWAVAKAYFVDLLPREPDLERFPVWRVPPPPFLSGAGDERLQKLLNIYASAYAYVFKKQRPHLRLGTRGVTRPILERAQRFFTGTDRPGIEETYGDGRRKVPEQISPAAWVRWSLDAWKELLPLPGARKKKVPPVTWIYQTGRLRSARTVNIFLHSSDHYFNCAPIEVPESARAMEVYRRMRLRIESEGFRSKQELEELAAPVRAEMRLLSSQAIRSAERSRQQAEELAAQGTTWLWS